MFLVLVAFVLLPGRAVGGEAFIQIFDLVEQNKTGPNDPLLVLTESSPAAGLFVVPKRYEYDLYPLDHMGTMTETINASSYIITLQKKGDSKVSYKHPFEEPLVLKTGDNAAIFVDAVGEDNVLLGTTCNTGPIPHPELDQAVIMICPPKTFELDKFAVIGSNTGCLGCKTGNDLHPKVENESVHFTIEDTNFPWIVNISYNGRSLCSSNHRYGDGGVYTLKVLPKETDGGNEQEYDCKLFSTVKPADFWKPIWVWFVVMVVLLVLVLCLTVVNKRYPTLRECVLQKLGMWDPEDEKADGKPSTRLQSLDTFRGLAITVMIFVNFEAGKYYFLTHAAWNGLSLADFVFPWFMFMVGVSIVLSVQSQLKRNTPKKVMLKKVTVRFIKLFLIGVFLNTSVPGGVELTAVRIPGVLQRIGFTYFVCSILEVLFVPRLSGAENYGGEKVEDNEYNECGKFLNDDPDIPEKKISNNWQYGENSEVNPVISEPVGQGWLTYLLRYTWPQLIVMVLLTAIWCVVTFVLPVPGCPVGYLGPGGIGDGGEHVNCTGGAAGYIDRLIWGKHMYQHPTCKPMYHTVVAHDPEGLLGSLTAVLTVYSGVIAGHIVVMLKGNKATVLTWLLGFTVVSLAAGLTMAKGSLTGGWVPINKNLWTVSFVAVTSASAYFLLALIYVLVDWKNIWCGAPFKSAGKNPLFLYVGSYILYNYFPFNWSTDDSHGMLLLQSSVGTAAWLLVGYYLDKKKKYYKI